VATLNQGVIATEDTRRLQLASDEDLDGRRAEFSLKNLKRDSTTSWRSGDTETVEAIIDGQKRQEQILNFDDMIQDKFEIGGCGRP